ncbi:MAG: CsgG/HfaB family protein [Phycisphaerales bacterium]|jgi:curli biogenesis system outer membrane secretion channel CsgG|nr:CsgG/HfaB family protein [Phycisphaerales bacterium]
MPRHIITGLVLSSMLAGTAIAQHQAKPRIAVQSISATPAVMSRAASDGSGVKNVLEQIMQGADSSLIDSLHKTGRFEVVAASDVEHVLTAQDVQASGFYDTSDPQTARAFQLAGFNFIASVTVTNFQLIDRVAVIPDAFGDSTYTIETIQLSAMLKIYDVTRGTVLGTAPINSEFQEETRLIEGAAQEGSYSNRLIALASQDFAAESATTILDSLAPPKVIGFEGNTIFFNRGASTGLKTGDLYELRDPGTAMIDPETGERLGMTSVPIGWAIVTNVGRRHAEAAPIELQRTPGISHTFLRAAPALPPHLSPSDRATGPYPAAAEHARPAVPAAITSLAGQPATPASQPTGAVVAVFVSNASGDIPDDRVNVFTSQLSSGLASRGVRVVSRQDVLNAASSLAPEGPNQGTGTPADTMAQRLLSDRASAVAIAQRLGASAVLSATIDSLAVDVTSTPSLNRTVADYSLATSWTLLESSTGASVGGGQAKSSERFKTSPDHDRIELNMVDRLLRADADQITAAVSERMATYQAQAGPASHPVRIEAILQNMMVPEIEQSSEGWTISGRTYPLTASDATISVDGVLVGSTPGPVSIREGTRRVQIEHPLCGPVDRYVQVDEFTGLLRIPITLSPEGQSQWEARTAFFESLKDNEVLREVAIEEAEALAEFMRKSRINIDTSNVQNLGIGQPSIWVQGTD